MRLSFIVLVAATTFFGCNAVLAEEQTLGLNIVQHNNDVQNGGKRVLRIHKSTEEDEERGVAQMFSKSTETYVKSRLNEMLVNPKYAQQKFAQWYYARLDDALIKKIITSRGEHFNTLFVQYLAWAGRSHGVA
ncbi:hypothetical protein PHMEG_00020318 [Phytophthora megakarya]|uniref:RxLR effector protein n=1 Tax=Phytophthora megakarya TaxID=4795 RepID=A0A225VR69_9STRA|nr:hypothetical protein PHMEG_00020318 [Phytophthora megakarya]